MQQLALALVTSNICCIPDYAKSHSKLLFTTTTSVLIISIDRIDGKRHISYLVGYEDKDKVTTG